MRQGYKFIRESGCEHDDDYLSHLLTIFSAGRMAHISSVIHTRIWRP